MKLTECRSRFLEGKIEKKTYWTLMRERLSILKEIEDILRENQDCRAIHIDKDDIVMEREDGIKLAFDFSQIICRAETMLIMGGDVEQEDIDVINRFLKGGEVVLDVGGNIGLFSLGLYACHPDVMFYSFEPIPSTYIKMQKNMRLNDVSETNIRTFNIGMSDREETVTFYLPGADEAASLRPIDDEYYQQLIDEDGLPTGERANREVTCTVTTIDDFCRENDLAHVDFIKIDVEGNERAVLLGAKDILQRDRPLVYSELLRKHSKRFGYHPNDVIAYMRELGYHCFTIRNQSLRKVEAVDDTTVETNFFFLHEEEHAKYNGDVG